MSDETKVLFMDTNAFLQVRDLKDIPWKELFHGVTAIDLMVAPSVINELDKHKTSTNQRRRDRARLALQQIDRASLEPDRALVVRDVPVRVCIVISIAPLLNRSEHPILDPANPDDQLVGEALSFGQGAGIFSHDTGPRIRARIFGLMAYEPANEWLLPIEQSDDQRTIAKLQGDLKRAQSQFPNIVAGFVNLDETTSEVRVSVPLLEPLAPEQVDRLADHYLSMHPPAKVYPTGKLWLGSFHGISDHQVEEYYADYSAFKADVHDYYARLHEHVRKLGVVAAVNYWVQNDSGVAAQGLRIEFDLEGEASLLSERDDAERFIGLSQKSPEPPDAPRERGDILGDFPLRNLNEPRDPVAFYWFNRPEVVSTHGALQCQEFRPKRKLVSSVLVFAHASLPAELSLRLHIEAANLPEPVSLSAKIIVAEKAMEWSDPSIQEILPEGVLPE